MLFDGCMDLLTKDLERVLCKSDQELLFVTKMEIKGSHSDVSDLDDLRDRCILIASLQEDLTSSLKQLRSHFCPSPLNTADVCLMRLEDSRVSREMILRQS